MSIAMPAGNPRDPKFAARRIPDFARLHAMEEQRVARWKRQHKKDLTVPVGFKLNPAPPGEAPYPPVPQYARPNSPATRPPGSRPQSAKMPVAPVAANPLLRAGSERGASGIQTAWTNTTGSRFVSKVKEAREVEAAMTAGDSFKENELHSSPFLRVGPPASNVLYPAGFKATRTVSHEAKHIRGGDPAHRAVIGGAAPSGNNRRLFPQGMTPQTQTPYLFDREGIKAEGAGDGLGWMRGFGQREAQEREGGRPAREEGGALRFTSSQTQSNSSEVSRAPTATSSDRPDRPSSALKRLPEAAPHGATPPGQASGGSSRWAEQVGREREEEEERVAELPRQRPETAPAPRDSMAGPRPRPQQQYHHHQQQQQQQYQQQQQQQQHQQVQRPQPQPPQQHQAQAQRHREEVAPAERVASSSSAAPAQAQASAQAQAPPAQRPATAHPGAAGSGRGAQAMVQLEGQGAVGALEPMVQAAPVAAAGKEVDVAQLRRAVGGMRCDREGRVEGAGAGAAMQFYTLSKTLGEGAYGKVRLGVHRLSGEKVAVKCFEKNKLTEPNARKRVAREIRILKALSHPFVIRLYEVVDLPHRRLLIMQYSSGGDLCRYVRENRRLSEAEACRLFCQIVDGLQYCHACGIVHRDVKLDNLLIDEDRNIKIVDFGFSVSFKDGQKLTKACGSPSYAAPEIVARRPYSPTGVDVWSLGVVLYAMVSGCFPFQGANNQELCRKIVKGKFECASFMSLECRDLVRRMLNVDPSRRITLDDCTQHVWCRAAFRKLERPPVHAHAIDCEESVESIDGAEPLLDPDDALVDETCRLGFAKDFVHRSVAHNKHNVGSTSYWLLQQRREATRRAVLRPATAT